MLTVCERRPSFRVYRLERMSIAWRHLRLTGFVGLGAPVKETFENKSVDLKVKINFRCLFHSIFRHSDEVFWL